MRHDMRKSGSQEIISLEEYLDRRQKIKEKESKKRTEKNRKEPRLDVGRALRLIILFRIILIGKLIWLLVIASDIFVYQCVGIMKDRDNDRTGNGSFQHSHCSRAVCESKK